MFLLRPKQPYFVLGRILPKYIGKSSMFLGRCLTGSPWVPPDHHPIPLSHHTGWSKKIFPALIPVIKKIEKMKVGKQPGK